MKPITLSRRVAQKPGKPERKTVNGKMYANVYEAAKMLDVHWTRIYALLREERFAEDHVIRDRQTWVRIDEIERYRKSRDWWNGLHKPKEAAAAGR